MPEFSDVEAAASGIVAEPEQVRRLLGQPDLAARRDRRVGPLDRSDRGAVLFQAGSRPAARGDWS